MIKEVYNGDIGFVEDVDAAAGELTARSQVPKGAERRRWLRDAFPLAALAVGAASLIAGTMGKVQVESNGYDA
jgi:hypothetical protein